MNDETARERWLPLALAGGGLLFGLALGLMVFFGNSLSAWLTAAPSTLAGAATSTPAPAPVVGAPAPDFTLTDLQGQSVSLSDYRGQVVLLNFWATWCGPCEAEMPTLEQRYQTLQGNGFVVLGVNADESEPEVTAFVRRLNLSFPVVLDPGNKINTLYRVRGYPTTIIIAPDGTVARVHVGYLTERQLDTYLSALGLGG